jgi:outer membrane biogenesis lipoprotein LolB
MEVGMVRKIHLMLLLSMPLALTACAQGQTATTNSKTDQQAMAQSQTALQTAQQAQVTANDAKQEADRMYQRSLQK